MKKVILQLTNKNFDEIKILNEKKYALNNLLKIEDQLLYKEVQDIQNELGKINIKIHDWWAYIYDNLKLDSHVYLNLDFSTKEVYINDEEN